MPNIKTGNVSAIRKTASKLTGLLLICLSAVLPLCHAGDSSSDPTPAQAAESCLNDFCKAVKAEDWPKAIRSLDLATADPMLLSIWNLEGYQKAEKLLSVGEKNLKKALEIMSDFPDDGEEFAEIRENLSSIPAATRKKLAGQLEELCRSLFEVETFPLVFSILTLSEDRKLLEATDDIVRLQLSVNQSPWEAVFRKNGKEWRLSSLQPLNMTERNELSDLELAYAKTMAKKKYDADSPEQTLVDFLRASGNLDFEKAQTFLSDDYTAVEANSTGKQNTKAAFVAMGRGLKSGSLHGFYAYEIEHAGKDIDREAVSTYLKSFAGKKTEKFFMETYQKKFKSDSTLALQTMSVVPDSRKVEGDSAFLDVTVCDPALGRTQIHFELVRKDGKWLVRKEVQTLLPPATDAEKKSMSGALRLMGVKFEDETENRFAGIYKNIDKAPLTVKAIREKNRKALWELLKKEDPDVSYDAVCMLYIPKYLTAEEVKGFQFNDVSRLDRLAAKLRDFYFLNDPGADFPDAWDYEQAEKWGTLSRLIVSQAVLGRFVWGSYQKRKASYLDQIFASWLDNAKITEDSAFLLYAFWSSYPLTPKMGYDRMKEIDILAKNGAPEWLTEYLRGNTAIQMAWDARGSGYASSVSKDGWDKFGDYLKQADRYLDHSIQLNPQNYLAYRDKITTAMGHGTSAQELDNFRKAIAINPDNSTHMSTLLTALLPRWGGSRREMMQLLLEGMKQDETKTEIPLLSYNSICESFFDDEHVPLTYRSVYLDPVVQDCGERLIAYALKQSEDVYYQNLIRYAQALFYLNSVRYREAIEAFEKITFRGYELDKFLYDNSVQVYQLYCPITPIYEDPKEAFVLRRSSIAPILQRIELNFVKEEITPAVARRQLLALADSDEAKADPSIRNALINLAAMWGDPDDPATNYKLNANHSGTAWECACISFSSSRMKFFFDHDFDVEAEPHFFLRARYYSGLISTASQLELSSAFQKTINDEARKHWKFIVGESDPKRTIDVESNSPVIDYILADAASTPGIRNLLAIEYSSRQKFIFKLQGDSLTVEPFLYGPLPSVITVNGRPWIDLSKPFRLPFKPDYSHGFSLSLKRASKWNSHAVCDGKDYAELLIVPDVENVDAQMMAVVVDFRTEAERNGESAASADSRTSAPTLIPPAANVDGKATVTIEGNIDGEDAFLFCDGWIVLVHKSNARPNGLTVNGKPWKDPSKPFQLGFTPDPAKTRYVCEGRGVSSMIRSEDTITIDVYDPSASSGHHKITLFEPSGASVTQAADEKDRSILIEGTIDGNGAFVFDGSTVRYRHGSFREPDDIKINGKPWTDLSEPFELGFTPSAETLSNIKVTGRGIAAMRMADGNLEVLIDDVAGGAGPYRIILSGREDKP